MSGVLFIGNIDYWAYLRVTKSESLEVWCWHLTVHSYQLSLTISIHIKVWKSHDLTTLLSFNKSMIELSEMIKCSCLTSTGSSPISQQMIKGEKKNKDLHLRWENEQGVITMPTFSRIFFLWASVQVRLSWARHSRALSASRESSTVLG